jgi:sugar lactone lactonase YvrE
MNNFENSPRVTSTFARTFAAVVLIVPLFGERVAAAGPLSTSASATVSVFATGLNNPRGLKFGPDGNLYVAEGGTGGLDSTVGQCEQVVPPVGPYTGSSNGGRISKIDANGVRTTVVDTLPSSQTSPSLGSLVSGVADVAFIGNTLYALLAGAGCSHGVPDVPNGIIRVNPDGSWSLIADLSAFQQAHPVQNPEPDDFEPDGTWYSMVAVRGALYAVEPNHGELDKITPDGQVSRVADISASQGHNVPTAVAYHGNFYVGNLNTFPIAEGSAKIYKITPSGQIKIVAEGLTTVLGVAFDARGRIYALENTTGNPFPTPGTGRVLRVHRSGVLETIAAGLTLPTAMTFGPDGNLYVSNLGFGPPLPGLGQVLKIEVTD